MCISLSLSLSLSLYMHIYDSIKYTREMVLTAPETSDFLLLV